MNMTTRVLLATVLMTVGGCFGGSGDGSGGPSGNEPPPTTPPPPPPPSPPTAVAAAGIWTGEIDWDYAHPSRTGGTQFIRALVAPNGKTRWIADDGSQYYGFIAMDGLQLRDTDDYGMYWAPPSYIDVRGDLFSSVALTGELIEQERIQGTFDIWAWSRDEDRTGRFTFDYDAVYERESSLATAAGTYSNETDTLAIDGEGALFYQSSMNGCTGNGHVAPIDPDFNMYELSIEIAGCTGSDAIRNGMVYEGLGYLGDSSDSARSDVFEFALAGPRFNGCAWICFHNWNLVARK